MKVLAIFFTLVASWLFIPILAFDESVHDTQALAKRQNINSTISEILSDIENATTCAGCEVISPVVYSNDDGSKRLSQSLLLVLQTLAHTGNDNFDNVTIGVCQLSVCRLDIS